MHPLVIEADEMQDFGDNGWIELIETMKHYVPGAQWRCLAEGQQVLTSEGWRPIELIKVGDPVWTHQNRWRPVVNVFNNGLAECVRVSGRGHYGIEMTPNHKVYLGELKRQKTGGKIRCGEAAFRPIEEASWDRRVQSAWASPAGVVTQDPVPALRGFESSVEWLWLYGLYVAEGYGVDFTSTKQRHRRVAWCINDSNCDEVHERLASLGIRSHFYRQGDHSVKVVASGADLHEWLTVSAGRLAHGKRLSMWVFGLSEERRQAVLDGMVTGDGCVGRRGRIEYATVSAELALNFKMLAQSLGYICSLTKKSPRLSQIDGRDINPTGHYVVYAQRERGRKQSVIDSGMVWSPVNPSRDIIPIGTRHVYDLEVAEDHSYVVEGVVVSNCHGVSRGVRDRYYRYTMGLDPDIPFFVHRYMAMHRPSWSAEERANKIAIYGGTEDNVDYRRNIYGEHGDATNPVFVLARLMQCWAPNTPVHTQVDGSNVVKSMKDIRVGDRVFNAMGVGEVTDVISSRRGELLRVSIDGEDLCCTSEHPFFTDRGWVHACNLRAGDQIFTYEGVRDLWRSADPQGATEILFKKVLGSFNPGTPEGVSDMSEGVPDFPAEDLLLSRMRIDRETQRQSAPEPVLSLLREGDSSWQGQLPILQSGMLECQSSTGSSRTDRVQGLRTEVYLPSKQEILLADLLGEVGGDNLWANVRYEQAVEIVRALRERVLQGGQEDQVLLDNLFQSAPDGQSSAKNSMRTLQDGVPAPASHSPLVQQGLLVSGQDEGSPTSAASLFSRVDRVEVLQSGSAEFARLSGGEDTITVYDLTVSGHPSFCVGQNALLVHNCVRMNESPWATTYNDDVYAQIKVNDELLRRSGASIHHFLDFPGNHLDKCYSSYWAGADVGFTRDPTEILIFGELTQPKGDSLLRLLARIHLMRISAADQADVIRFLFEYYGERLRCVALDKTGNGLPLWQELDPEAVGTSVHLRRTPEHIARRIKGYNFSSKVAVEFDDRELERDEKPEDALIMKNVIDFSTDQLRKLVDSRPPRLELPNDRELLTEFQGQEVQYVRDEGSAAGVKRRYSGGSFHTLDAAKVMIAGRDLQAIEEMLRKPQRNGPILERFGGMG